MAKYTALEFSLALRKMVNAPSQAAKGAAKRIAKDIQSNFSLGQDPYEKKWKSLAKATLAKGRFEPPLTDTRTGRGRISVVPMQGAGIKLLSSVGYMAIHQKGNGKHPPRRSFFPTNVMPKAWLFIWEDEIKKAVARSKK